MKRENGTVTGTRVSRARDTKIKDVQPLQMNVNVVFEVIEQGEVREIPVRDPLEIHRVCDFTVADGTGKITLTLWNEDIDTVEVNKTYRLSNGFVNIYRNSLRLAKGKRGTLEEDPKEFDYLDEYTDRSAEYHGDPRRDKRGYRSTRDMPFSSHGNDRSYRRSDKKRRRDNRW